MQKTEELVEIARRLPASERERFLRAKTTDHPQLFAEVMVLMNKVEADSAATATSGLGRRDLPTQETAVTDDSGTQPAVAFPALEHASDLQSGLQIGNLRIERMLAQGGMGAVYLATQVEEGFERRVAVKVVKPELATRGVMLRFFQERRVLAALDHPNVARLLDAGTTGEGTPYLVMEYVEGLRIDDYCEVNQLDTEQRIRLFLTVCDAMQYAHQRLVVHRDIKPSNILVTSDGVPKLLDFGIAKLITPDVDDTVALKSGLTTGGESPMTPMYASPEQVRAEAVTTATDIYSLAILLYELITGSLPYEFKMMTAAGVERTICETEPTPPSQAKVVRPLFGDETVQKLRKRLEGELDLILLMALRKEPDRRYASVYQFSEDLRRHLIGEPVLAHKDTFRYRVGKFVTRHRGAVAAATLAVLSLAASSVISLYFANVARQEKLVAERRFQETKELAGYVVTDLDDAIRRGETAARRELVEKGLTYLKRLSEEAGGDLELQREVLRGYVKMGDILGNPFAPNLGEREKARQSYLAARATGEKFGGRLRKGPLRAEMALVQRKLADLDAASGKAQEALAAYREVEGEFTGLELGSVQYQIGWVESQLNRKDEALASFRRAMELAGQVLQEEPRHKRGRELLAASAERVGQMLADRNEYDEAIENLRAALRSHDEQLREEPDNSGAKRRVWSASVILGDVYKEAGHRQEAQQAYRRAVLLSEQQWKQDPDNRQHRTSYFTTVSRLAEILDEIPGKREEARGLTGRLLADMRPIVNSGRAAALELDVYVWTLLTTPFIEFRNAQAALPLAEQLERVGGGQDPRVVDMLALAQFGTGDVRKAIETEKRALALVGPAPSKFRSELEGNLSRFERSAAAQQR